MSAVRTPWDPAIKDENLRLTLAKQEADYIRDEHRSVTRRLWALVLVALLLISLVVAAVVHNASVSEQYDRYPDAPYSSLFLAAFGIGILGLMPAVMGIISALLRLLKVQGYRRKLKSFLARYNRTLQ